MIEAEIVLLIPFLFKGLDAAWDYFLPDTSLGSMIDKIEELVSTYFKEGVNKNGHSLSNSKNIKLKPIFNFFIFLAKIMVLYFILLIAFIVDIADGNLEDGIIGANFYIITFVLTLFLACLVFPFVKLKYRKTYYVLNTKGIYYKSAFPCSLNLSMEYLDIQRFAVRQGYFQKKYGIGDIIIIPKNKTQNRKITLSSIDRVMEVKKLLDSILAKFSAK